MLTHLDAMKVGYDHFRRQAYPEHEALMKTLCDQGQSPKVCVLTCADSRIEPHRLFNTAPGDLFVLRNVANLVPAQDQADSTHAGLMYAIYHLEVSHLVLLGHSHCGGIRALLDLPDTPSEDESCVCDWIRCANDTKIRVKKEVKDLTLDQQAKRLEEESMKDSIARLMAHDYVKKRVENKSLMIHAWHYTLEEGLVTAWDRQRDCFVPLS